MTDAFFWLRAVDSYGESMCKPVRVKGEIYIREGGMWRFMATKRAVLMPHTSGIMARMRYVDPATGLELPEESQPTWPPYGGCTLHAHHSIGIASGRLSVNLPWYTPPDPVEVLASGLPKKASPASEWPYPFPTPKDELRNEDERLLQALAEPLPISVTTAAATLADAYDARVFEVLTAPVPAPRVRPALQDVVIPAPAYYMTRDGRIVNAEQLTAEQQAEALPVRQPTATPTTMPRPAVWHAAPSLPFTNDDI